MNRERGHPVRATVKCIKGTCNAGHRVGDVVNVSARQTAGMCGYLYHAAHPAILMLQFGGSVPWGAADSVELQCPDTLNLLTLELRRIRDDEGQDEPAALAAEPCLEGRSKAAGPEPGARPAVRLGRVVCTLRDDQTG